MTTSEPTKTLTSLLVAYRQSKVLLAAIDAEIKCGLNAIANASDPNTKGAKRLSRNAFSEASAIWDTTIDWLGKELIVSQLPQHRSTALQEIMELDNRREILIQESEKYIDQIIECEPKSIHESFAKLVLLADILIHNPYAETQYHAYIIRDELETLVRLIGMQSNS